MLFRSRVLFRSYMRTDAPSLSQESINDARNYIKENIGNKYLTDAPRIYSSTENAQEAHEAVRPTNPYLQVKDLINLSDEENKLYQLIWERFIASQLPDAEYLSTSAKIQVNNNTFVAKGREVVLIFDILYRPTINYFVSILRVSLYILLCCFSISYKQSIRIIL